MLIAAANPDMMESMIDEGDIVILGNRYESQLCAIEMEAKCLIICEGQRYPIQLPRLQRAITVLLLKLIMIHILLQGL